MYQSMGGLWTNGKTIWHRRGDTGVLGIYTWWPPISSVVLPDENRTGKLTVKRHASDENYVFQLDMTEDGGFVFPPEMTKNLTPGKYVYDVEITHGDGTIQTIAIGTYKLLPDVTN